MASRSISCRKVIQGFNETQDIYTAYRCYASIYNFTSCKHDMLMFKSCDYSEVAMREILMPIPVATGCI